MHNFMASEFHMYICTSANEMYMVDVLLNLRVELKPLVLPCRRHEQAHVIFSSVRVTVKSDY